MAVGVARDVDHRSLDRAEHHRVAMRDDAVDRELASDFRRAGDGAAGRRLDRFVAAGVIGVPVGVPDLGDAPALLVGLPQILGRIGCIDRRGFVAVGVVDEVAVVVAKAGELVNVDHGGGLTPACPNRKGPPAGCRRAFLVV